MTTGGMGSQLCAALAAECHAHRVLVVAVRALLEREGGAAVLAELPCARRLPARRTDRRAVRGVPVVQRLGLHVLPHLLDADLGLRRLHLRAGGRRIVRAHPRLAVPVLRADVQPALRALLEVGRRLVDGLPEGAVVLRVPRRGHGLVLTRRARRLTRSVQAALSREAARALEAAPQEAEPFRLRLALGRDEGRRESAAADVAGELPRTEEQTS